MYIVVNSQGPKEYRPKSLFVLTTNSLQISRSTQKNSTDEIWLHVERLTYKRKAKKPRRNKMEHM